MFGILLGVLSTTCMAARELLSKHLAAHVSGTASAFATFLFALPWYLVVWLGLRAIGFEHGPVAAGFWIWVTLRSLSDVGAEWCKMSAISTGEISLVSCVLALTPVVILLLSPVITGDPISRLAVLGTGVVVSGSIGALWRPGQPLASSDAAQSRSAVLFGLASAGFFGLNNCFDRLSVQTASPLLSGCLMTLLAGVFLLPTVIRKKGAALELAAHKKPFFIRGGFEISFMVTKLYALQYLQGPEVSAILRLTLLFSVIGGRVMFKELNFVRKTIGALLTILGVAIIVLSHS